MGAIQGSINSMLGSVAVAAAGAKHIKEQKAANEIAKAGMAEKKAGVDEELLKLEGEQETQEKASPQQSRTGYRLIIRRTKAFLSSSRPRREACS